MTSILSTLLFAGAATAQLTTSFVFLRSGFGTDKIGFVGSVAGVSGDHTTVVVNYDNGTNRERFADGDQTFTVGPTLFEVSTDRIAGVGGAVTTRGFTNGYAYNLRCEFATTPADATPTCTASYGPIVARQLQCQSNTRSQRSTRYLTETYTYSGRLSYSAGVETIVRTVVYAAGGNQTSIPAWCSNSNSFPSGYVTSNTARRDDIATYQLVITAGQEKLSATQGASASVSNATPTGSGASARNSASASNSVSTGAAMPMKTAAPVVAGLGVAIAALM